MGQRHQVYLRLPEVYYNLYFAAGVQRWEKRTCSLRYLLLGENSKRFTPGSEPAPTSIKPQ